MRFVFLCFFALFTIAAQPAGAKSGSPMHTISVQTAKGSQTWQIELASDAESRAKGLMFRKQMDADKGMLFRFEQTRPIAMWMKNTFISLDMIFIREDGTIARIESNTTPESEEIVGSGEPVRYVLEINAGQAEEKGLKPGMLFRHPWFVTSN
ncbi:DUF192 domain-containing protein [Pseudahrensia aquimaris]|uniref:DUF192 domain-containing protein n=1 Tax=Pseudahrensia aquimaris TaxID=744461 RepID=A0ABW3FDU1_9HYPH